MSVMMWGELNPKNSTTQVKLSGIDWPSEELQALFNMVPANRIHLHWYRGLGFFSLRRHAKGHDYAQVHAVDGHNIERWREVLAQGLKND